MDIVYLIQDIVQVVTILLCIVTLIIGFMWTKRNKVRRQWATPIATWVIHRLIFYAYVQLSVVFPLPKDFFSFWSTAVGFHGIVVIFMTIFTLNVLNGKVMK